jgi:hypothetical protein
MHVRAGAQDGNVKSASSDPAKPMIMPHVEQPGYPPQWREVVAEETGDRYAMPEEASLQSTSKRRGAGAGRFKAKGM